MKPGKRVPQSPLGPLLFMTWLVAMASVATGASLPVATGVAFVLTLFCFQQLWHNQNGRRPERDRSRWNRAGAARGPRTWSEAVLAGIRDLRCRARRGRNVQLSLITAIPPKPALHRFEGPQARPSCSEDDRWAGLLTVLALAALLFSGTAMAHESTRLVELNEHFSVFIAVDVLGVALLPVMIGILCRSEIHSILTMISLSAALQAILFRLAASVPEGSFLALAALAIVGIPLGFVWFWGSIDGRLEPGPIETTTGKLLRGKWLRMRPGKHPTGAPRRSS
jgi:hypothetical protein